MSAAAGEPLGQRPRAGGSSVGPELAVRGSHRPLRAVQNPRVCTPHPAPLLGGIKPGLEGRKSGEVKKGEEKVMDSRH